MKYSTISSRWYVLPLYLFLALPSILNADIGVVAIAVNANLQDKGAFETNSVINVGDVISTGANGNLTILFNDESMLTLGPNTKAEIVKYSETPAPGVSEIKIISGSFNYFPGTILENGGQQVLTNLAHITGSNPSVNESHNDAINQAAHTNSSKHVSSSLNANSDDASPTRTGNTSLAVDTINSSDINAANLGIEAKPIINLVVASSGATDGSNGGNTSVSGTLAPQAAIAAPEPTVTLDPAYHIETSHEGPHLKAGTANGHVPHS